MRFNFSTPMEIARVLKRIRKSKMGTPSLARIIQDVDLTLKTLEIFYCAHGAVVEGLDNRNGHKRKVVGKGKVSVGEVHGTKVRGVSTRSPKICSCTVIC